MWYAKEYNPIQVGSIDGTDIDPHDNAITRATASHYRAPKHLKTDPNHTLFVSRLNFDTTESTLKPFFEKYGSIKNIELIRNNVTGLSQGYAFITFKDTQSAREAYKYAHEATLDDHVILVDYERSRVMKGWVPRRFGGGFGGRKESGQLRFGARDRPFRDNNGKIHVDYEQKRSDVWKIVSSNESGSKRSSGYSSSSRGHHSRTSIGKDRRDKSSSRDHPRRTSSRDRRDKLLSIEHRPRISSRERRDRPSSRELHRHLSTRYDDRDRRHHHYKRKREDNREDYSRSSRQKFQQRESRH